MRLLPFLLEPVWFMIYLVEKWDCVYFYTVFILLHFLRAHRFLLR